MLFHIRHDTQYHYHTPASDSFAELRVCPQNCPGQKILRRRLDVKPSVIIETYTDYFGNAVEFFSIPFRHDSLSVLAFADVQTYLIPFPQEALQHSLEQATAVYKEKILDVFDFLQPSAHVPFSQGVKNLSLPFCPSKISLENLLLSLNEWIFKNFSYTPGSTTVSTPLEIILKERKGVCQDFAHLMLAILRQHGIPARYVSGYIEAYDPTQPTSSELIGAAASHAWVEVYLPNGQWWGLDPTNNQCVGERHVRVAVGRDYRDVAPLRGTFKGAYKQDLQVIVSVERKKRAPVRKRSARKNIMDVPQISGFNLTPRPRK